jgi:DNA-binding MarR family transcriptional regulator
LSSHREISASVGLELRRLIAGVVLFNTAMAEHLGMSPIDSQVLHLLQLEVGPVTAGRFGELAHLPSSTTTRVIDRLEARGYVHRVRDTTDRRRVLIYPDEQKTRELEKHYDEQTAAMNAVLAGLSAADLAAAHRFLARLNQAGSVSVPR